jgi:hypothetical protein
MHYRRLEIETETTVLMIGNRMTDTQTSYCEGCQSTSLFLNAATTRSAVKVENSTLDELTSLPEVHSFDGPTGERMICIASLTKIFNK